MNDIIEEKSCPSERGKRLKTLRNMCGLTIQEFAKKYGVGASTLKYWESARSEGLSPKGAKKIIEAMLQEGVYSTFTWLMYGIGIHPQILDVQKSSAQKHLRAMNSTYDEEIAIAKEVNLFLKNSTEAITLVVFDDAMEPLYSIGNTIGGIRVHGSEMVTATGKDCIVETENGEILCRKLTRGNEPDTFHLCALSYLTTVFPPNLYDVKLKSVAPIIRIWKRIGRPET